MKKIDFGYANEDNPLGAFEGIGLGQTENGKAYGPITGKILGVVSIDESDYLVAETIMAFGNAIFGPKRISCQ